MADRDPLVRCPECGGLGWLLNELHTGRPDNDPTAPLSLDLLPCIYPDCDAPVVDGGPRPIVTLGIRGQFDKVVRSPRGTLMALTGFTEPVYR